MPINLFFGRGKKMTENFPGSKKEIKRRRK
jgi:hypothetical protein